MAVRRIVANIKAEGVETARRCYGDILGMDVVMDLGWIDTFASDWPTTPQISIAAEGGSGTPMPDFSNEVDDIDQVYRLVCEVGLAVEYGPTREPWDVRLFYVRDPFGRLVNILAHD
jgi:catechol 2,3-dioxygenase-like lactoylglutathione lyase family enzyme